MRVSIKAAAMLVILAVAWVVYAGTRKQRAIVNEWVFGWLPGQAAFVAVWAAAVLW